MAKDKNYCGLDTTLLHNENMKYWVKWYLDGANPKDFKQFGTLSDNMEFTLKNYPNRSDVQACIIDYTKRKKDMDLVNVYNVMLKNALDGDVQSANWLVQFSKTDFFKKETEDELHKFVEGLSTDE